MKILYRYEIEYKNEDGDTAIHLREFPVIRETEYTYFIDPIIIGIPREAKKRVSKTANKTYAYSTKEEAKKHFISRTETRIAWFEFWTEECKKALELIKKI